MLSHFSVSGSYERFLFIRHFTSGPYRTEGLPLHVLPVNSFATPHNITIQFSYCDVRKPIFYFTSTGFKASQESVHSAQVLKHYTIMFVDKEALNEAYADVRNDKTETNWYVYSMI